MRADDAASTPLDVSRVRSDLSLRTSPFGPLVPDVVLDDPNAGKTEPNMPSSASNISSSLAVSLSDGRRSPAAAAASVASFSDREALPSEVA